MADKEVRSDATLKNLPPEELEVMWRFRNPTEGGKKLSLEEVLLEVPLRYGFAVSSLSTVSEFYSWLRLKRRMDAAADTAAQVRLELAKDPDVSPDDLEAIAQKVFTAEALEGGDIKGFVALAKLKLAARALDHDARKLRMLEDSNAAAKKALADATTRAKAGGGISEETLRELEEAAKLL